MRNFYLLTDAYRTTPDPLPATLFQIVLANQSTPSKTVYLTFDDGPIPEVTPWVLNVLNHYKVKATFFCVGDNVRKHPDVYQQLLEGGIKPVITPSTIYRYGTTKHPSCWTIQQKQMH